MLAGFNGIHSLARYADSPAKLFLAPIPFRAKYLETIFHSLGTVMYACLLVMYTLLSVAGVAVKQTLHIFEACLS